MIRDIMSYKNRANKLKLHRDVFKTKLNKKEYYIQTLIMTCGDKSIDDVNEWWLNEMTAYEKKEIGFVRVTSKIEEDLLKQYYDKGLEDLDINEKEYLEFYMFVNTLNCGLLEKANFFTNNVKSDDNIKVESVTKNFIKSPYAILNINNDDRIKYIYSINLNRDNSIKEFVKADFRLEYDENINLEAISNILLEYELTKENEVFYINDNEYLGIKKITNNEILISKIIFSKDGVDVYSFICEKKNEFYWYSDKTSSISTEMIDEVAENFIEYICEVMARE